MRSRPYRRWIIVAALIAAVSIFVVVGSTLGTSANSPIAGTWVQATSVVAGALGLAGSAVLLLAARAPRGK